VGYETILYSGDGPVGTPTPNRPDDGNNPRLPAPEALAAATRAMALEIAERGAFALVPVKTAFSARHGGVGRLARDLLLRSCVNSAESHEPGASFAVRRQPAPEKSCH
jgi:naphthoate synthase